MMDVLASMAQINQVPVLLSEDLSNSIHSATDITGFGLLGHSLQMAEASRVKFKLKISQIPFFALAPSLIEKGFLTKAHRTYKAYVEEKISWDRLSEGEKQLCVDPQTSGGLLLSVDAEKSSAVLQTLQKEFPFAKIIGEVHCAKAAIEFVD
jgi:selenide,water dikinase